MERGRTPKFIAIFIGVVLWQLTSASFTSANFVGTPQRSNAPFISEITIVTPGDIQQYTKFEVAFNISTLPTNPYFPFDPTPPPGVPASSGISVDTFFLAPGESDWNTAVSLPCFYYQPMQTVTAGSETAFFQEFSAVYLTPLGAAEWRCRFTPQETGVWHFKIKATDANGTAESPILDFETTPCSGEICRGFVGVSKTDPRFFEFANGDPFITPLLNVEEGSPFNDLTKIRTNIPLLGNNGIHFVRWFPTGEGTNMFVIPFGDSIRVNWGFGDAWTVFDNVDTQAGKQVSLRPYFYSTQRIPVQAGVYQFSLRARVIGEQVIRMQVGSLEVDICAAENTNHTANGQDCDFRHDGWQDYTLEYISAGDNMLEVGARGLYVSADAPPPFSNVYNGAIAVHSLLLQRFEPERNAWSGNCLTRGDPDTHTYIDQRSAARLDEILALSEQLGVYHKLTLFHKNESLLNRLQADGAFGDYDASNANFYAADDHASRWYQRAYVRYFIGRWSYSTALHSLELANETDPWWSTSQTAGLSVAQFVHTESPRHILMSNSFWHSFPDEFWSDPVMDYADKHWYASPNSSDGDLISLAHADSAAYVRECFHRLNEYKVMLDSPKPILRGEGGYWGAGSSWDEQHAVILDPTGTWYHKKLWAHVGMLGNSCDGEWYPRLFVPPVNGRFPNNNLNLGDMFATYDRFMQDEPLNNGHYMEIGVDLENDQQILLAQGSGSIRAWGVRDVENRRVLLWIDNANHTWQNVVDGMEIPPESAQLIIQGMPQGSYTVEIWDTHDGLISETTTASVTDNNELQFNVTNLAHDMAVKFIGSPRPRAIDALHISPAGTGIILSWPAVTTDTAGEMVLTEHYNIYRSDLPYFLPSVFFLRGATNSSEFHDPDVLLDFSDQYSYVVTAVDSAGNEAAISNRVGKFDFMFNYSEEFRRRRS